MRDDASVGSRARWVDLGDVKVAGAQLSFCLKFPTRALHCSYAFKIQHLHGEATWPLMLGLIPIR